MTLFIFESVLIKHQSKNVYFLRFDQIASQLILYFDRGPHYEIQVKFRHQLSFFCDPL